MDRLKQEFKSDRTLNQAKSAMLKLRHDWGKDLRVPLWVLQIKQDSEAHQRFKKIAAKVASETFNQTSFYDLHAEQKTPKGYVACLRKCDTFPTDYKDEFLER